MSRKHRSKPSGTQPTATHTSTVVGTLDVHTDHKFTHDNERNTHKLRAIELLKKILTNFNSIWLIFRRFFASVINSAIAFFVLLFISFLTGCYLWFLSPKCYIEFKWFYVVFAVLYGTFGNLGWYTIPPIGGRITRTTLKSKRNTITKFFQYFTRNLLYIFFPVIIIFSSPNLSSLIKTENRGLFYISITLGLFFMFFSTLILPISIIVGKGRQGLHDKICGLVLCSKSDHEYQEIPGRKLLYTSSLYALFLSIVLTIACHAWFFGFSYDKILFPGEERQKYTTEIESFTKELEKIYKAESLKHRKTYISDGLTWWVDLESDVKERIHAAQEIGLKDLNTLDLLGYGVKIYDTDHQIDLIDLKRENTKIIPYGSRIFSIFIFVDSGIFYQKELEQIVIKYFVDKTLDTDLGTNSDAIRVKVIRLVKAGVVKLGFFDEFYLTPGVKSWRSKEMLDLPIIVDLETGNQFVPAYLNCNDFR